MTKLEKKEGNVEQCPTCHEKIYCKMTKGSEKYPAKLQWQNQDGKAHYSFDFATKTTSCKSEVKDAFFGSEPVQKLITMPTGTKGDIQILERMNRDAYETAKQYIAKYIGVKEACDECGITNPAVLGMIYKSVVEIN